MTAPAGAPLVQCVALPMSAGPHSDSRSVNSLLLAGQPRTLIDAGMPFPESLRTLEAGLATYGVRLAEIEQLVITHTHPDHYGCAAAIVRAAQAAGRRVRVLAHPRAAAVLGNLPAWWMQAREHSLTLLRQAGAPSSMIQSDWNRPARSPLANADMNVAVDAALADGAVVETTAGSWQALHTPGHASTQLCLYRPDSGELLSSDHVLPDVTANMVLEPPAPGEPPAHPILDYLASLRRLQALPITRVWPGHGAPFGDAQAVLASRIERCEQRMAQVAALLVGQARTAWEVAEAIYAGTAAAGSQRGLFQVVAYLDALEAQGRLVLDADNDVWRYRERVVSGT